MAYEQSLWDRIFRSGTLHIESAGENGQETLVNIPRANDVQQTLNRLIEADSNRREYPRPPRLTSGRWRASSTGRGAS